VFGRIMRNVSQTKTILVAPFRRTVLGRLTTTPVRDPHQSHHRMLYATRADSLGRLPRPEDPSLTVVFKSLGLTVPVRSQEYLVLAVTGSKQRQVNSVRPLPVKPYERTLPLTR
jgi:hypothetical protein